MTIQFNTDRTIESDERNQDYFTTLIAEELDRYASHITRVEAHLTDQNGKKDGINDIRCLLEARIEGRQPIAVSDQAATLEKAVSGAIEKLRHALETKLSKMEDY
jgi:ribosome-associated translation inhibitor RaiA